MFADLDQQDRQEQLDALRLLQNLQRTPTFRRVLAVLTEKRDTLEQDLATVGLSHADRAMLHGRLSMVVELVLHLGRLLVDKELADRTPSLEPDAPLGSLLDPVRSPDLM